VRSTLTSSRFHNTLGAASLFWGVALMFAAGPAVACRNASAPPQVRLDLQDERRPAIEVLNLNADHARLLSSTAWTRDQWSQVLRISVGEQAAAMAGEYAVTGNRLRFIPMFPLDPGRTYSVTYNPAAIPGSGAAAAVLTSTVTVPAVVREPSTMVSQVFPSAEVVPANQLRLYIHFSAPMGLRGGLDHITLLNESGQPVVDPFLPLDAEFWNDDRTRYTVFFDPGRQKRGILPNQQMGRSLEPGQRYTLRVSREWRDGEGLPLKEDFIRAFRVGPPDERPLDHAAWRLTLPGAGTRQPVVVAFGEPLDHGLLLRALGITGADGRFLAGDIKVEAGESRWSFTPRAAWTTGAYQLTALAMLEDLAGNRIGRAFEVDIFERADRSSEPERTSIPFSIH
jgi:hypothetical protein